MLILSLYFLLPLSCLRPKDTTIQDFVSQADNVIQKPGSIVDRIVKATD